MKSITFQLDDVRSEKLSKLCAATAGNVTGVSIAGEHVEFEQPKLSRTKLAQAFLNSSIDRAFSQLPQ